jgi:hypothetical protein
MPDESVERRLQRLEREIEEVRRGLYRQPGQPGRDDWQSTIGAFLDDPVAAEVFRDLQAAFQRELSVPFSEPRRFDESAPKGRNKLAQGNALGVEAKHGTQALKGRNNRSPPRVVAPLQGVKPSRIPPSQGVALGFLVPALRAEELPYKASGIIPSERTRAGSHEKCVRRSFD